MSSPQSAVRSLVKQHNLSEAEIVSRLLELGVKTSQPTINRIKRGKARTINFDVGTGLLKLHETLTQQG